MSGKSDYVTIGEKVWPDGCRAVGQGTATGLGSGPNQYQCTYVTKKSALGDGHFSVVKECMNTMTKDRYAMKLVDKRLVVDKLQLIQREISVLKRISELIRELERVKKTESGGNQAVFEGHHHVLQLFDFFETPKNIVLITQLCEPEDLYDKILNAGHLDLKKQVQPFTACILSALQFLHEHGIIHRDIKAENVLFRLRNSSSSNALLEVPQEGADYDTSAHDLILADFGLAIKASTGSTEFVGTISYLAPEIVACKNSARMSAVQLNRLRPYGRGVDIWALGVLCYFMAFGYMPFDCETDAETMDCITKSDYYMDEEKVQDPDFKEFWSFLERCFDVEMDTRSSADELAAHEFLCAQYFPNKLAKSTDAAKGNSATKLTTKPVLKVSKSSSNIHSRAPPSRSASTLSMDLGESMRRSNSSEANLNRIRETLKKTLSMTSIKNAGGIPNPNANIANNFNRGISTFTLEPELPNVALMNGCLCATPKSYSNFTTSPVMSRNASRSNINTAYGSWNEPHISALNSGATLTDSEAQAQNETMSLAMALGSGTSQGTVTGGEPLHRNHKTVFEL